MSAPPSGLSILSLLRSPSQILTVATLWNGDPGCSSWGGRPKKRVWGRLAETPETFAGARAFDVRRATPTSASLGRKSLLHFRRAGPLLGGTVTCTGRGGPAGRLAAPRRPEGAGALTMAAGADADSRRAAVETATVAPERGGGSCVLCCGDLEATALGRCDHPVCYRCSTKMRVLCEQRYCAVCREELRQVRRGRRTARSGRRGCHGGAAGRGGTGRRAYGIRKETFLPAVRPPAWWRLFPKERPGGPTPRGVC